MLKRLFFAIMLLLLVCTLGFSTDYYVDATEGNDENPGTQAEPWKTIGKVNSSMGSFSPGDNIYFQRGETWTDGRLYITCSGSSGSPITFADYGSGTKPIINYSSGPARISTANVSYITIKNIRATTGSGVYASADNLSHIIVDGLELINMSSNAIFFQRINTYAVKNTYIENAGTGGIVIYGSEYYKICNDTIDNVEVSGASTDCLTIHPSDIGTHLTGPNHSISNSSFHGGGGSAVSAKFYVSDSGWTINADGSTDFYVYYGNSGATDGDNPTGVFDSNYKAVWMLNEASGTIYDLTSNNHDSDAQTITAYQATGKLHYAIEFNSATTDYFTLPDHADWDLASDTPFTLEALAKPDNTDANTWIFRRYDGYGYALGQTNADSGYWKFYVFGDGQIISNSAPTGNWQYVAGRRDSSGNMRIFVDGVEQTATDTDTATVSSTEKLWIGRQSSGDRPFDGLMDELRFSKTNRSNAWIKFTRYNWNETDNELTWGSEEQSSLTVSFTSTPYTTGETGSKTITVTLSGQATEATTVDYATSNGTANAGEDYTSTSGTLTWTTGQGGNKTFNVSITEDTKDEPDETINLTLSDPVACSITGTNPETLTIHDVFNVFQPKMRVFLGVIIPVIIK